MTWEPKGMHGWIPWNGNMETAQAQVEVVLNRLRTSGMPNCEWSHPITFWADGDRLFFEASQ